MSSVETTTPDDRLTVTSLFLSENRKELYLCKYCLTASLSLLSRYIRDIPTSTCSGVALSAPVMMMNDYEWSLCEVCLF